MIDALIRMHSPQAAAGVAEEESSTSSVMLPVAVAAAGIYLYFKLQKSPHEVHRRETPADYGG